MIKRIVLPLIIWVASLAHADGFYELDLDWNKRGKQVTTVVVGAPVGPFAPMLVGDSTGYYEGFVGYPMKLGPVSVTPHLGLEGLKGVNPKARGMLITSTQLGPLSAMTVNEFGGVTGNFHKERLWVDASSYSLGLVRHSFAGIGPRIDYRLGSGTTMYLQYLRKDKMSRLTLAISGEF
ncbi:MAG: hypothetical protein KBD65_02420 [Candidatus Moranbacteria bacterium]|nr:hypothetical protein [Candidatus Moranbacteria bacterium]